ncbi:SNF2/RAD54 helicase family protein, putative [Eimeria maxima]|uniref:SNF2/RAD54 helicase family protein, putative n=1 Tax=Eimeria maxima TaxID=5804 RepID=U6MB33_EIMMA|nr:SNF2/RAD54 helicase family protein, putative [Eimeria maxima]CDJ61427.1 SNF2/RAD54 helicase family protein, putative [Eimeria maxima]
MAWMIPNELSDIVTTKTSLPTPSTEECFYWPKERQWVPERLLKKLKPGERQQLQGAKAMVQKAASGQSKCRKCGGSIAKGTLRVGYPTSDPRGAYEVLCCWLHLGCSRELFTLILNEQAEGDLIERLREDLITSISCLEAVAAKPVDPPKTETKAAGAHNTPREEFTSLKNEQPVRRTRVTGRDTAVAKAEQREETGSSKKAPAFAPSTACKSSNASVASASSTLHEGSNDSGSLVGGGGSDCAQKDKKGDDELPARDRLLLDRAGCIVSLDRLCLMADSLSQVEQREVQEALAEAALWLFFPDEVQKETVATAERAEEVLEGLTRRVIKGRVASPNGLLLPLLPFQEEGLWWLAQQEASHIKGGILADEMGMGKTIQIISLLLCRPLPSLPDSVPSLMRACVCSTLIVTPLAALLQWKSELDRFVVPGRLSVLIYHGSQRRALHSVLHQYDVVLTTYQTVEQDFRKQINKHKVSCKYCGRLFMRDKLFIHQKYFCGPDAQRTAKQRLTERKVDEGTKRAMVSLNIINADDKENVGAVAVAASATKKRSSKKRKDAATEERTGPVSFVPTPGNCLKELLEQANINPDEVGPLPWLGPHAYRSAKAAAEAAESPGYKRQKTASESSSSASSEAKGNNDDEETGENGELTMAEVSRLKVAELRELIKALGGTIVARSTKAQLLEQLEPLLQRSLLREAAADTRGNDSEGTSTHKSSSRKPHESSEGDQGDGELQPQQGAAPKECRSRPQAGRNVKCRNGSQLEAPSDGEKDVEHTRRSPKSGSSTGNGETHALGTKAQDVQPVTRERQGAGASVKHELEEFSGDGRAHHSTKESAGSTNSSSNSRKNKPAFKYVKPVKPQEQRCEADSSEDGRPLSVSKKKKPTEESKDKTAEVRKNRKYSGKKGSRKVGQNCIKPKKPVKKASEKRSGRRRPASRRPDSSASEWESSSTEYEPSDSSSSENDSSESFVATTSDGGPDDADSDVSSVISVLSSDSTKRRARTSRNADSSNSKEPPKRIPLTPVDELLWGKALGDTESENEEEGGQVKERLEEDPNLVEALRQSPLHGVVWQRIVLDEAHRIKSRNSSTAQAIFALRSATIKVPGCHGKKEQRQKQVLEKQVDVEDAKDSCDSDAIQPVVIAGDDGQGTADHRSRKVRSHCGKKRQLQPQDKQQQRRAQEEKQDEDAETEQQGGSAKVAGSSESMERTRHGSSSRGPGDSGNEVARVVTSRCGTEPDFSIVVGGCRWYCDKCSHTRMTHYSFFCRRVVKPIKEFGYQGEGIVALETLKREVLDVCLLRRTKVERAADVKLPPLVVSIRRDALSPQERDFYESLFKQTATQFDSYVKSGTVLHNFAHIFDLLSRLRQAVDHPYLLIHGSLQSKEGCSPLPTDSRNAQQTGVCAICQEDMDAIV